jgi:hypothetical protein
MNTRGIRNNNPGNIDRTNINWQGMAADQSGDPRFIVFRAPEWGIRAIAKIVLAYYSKDGCDTIRKIIERWAPPGENDTNAYVADVAAKCGVHPDDRCDVCSGDVLAAIVQAIIQHENGQQPYSQSQIASGLLLAGVGQPGATSGTKH